MEQDKKKPYSDSRWNNTRGGVVTGSFVPTPEETARAQKWEKELLEKLEAEKKQKGK